MYNKHVKQGTAWSAKGMPRSIYYDKQTMLHSYEQLSYAQYTVLFAMLNRLGTELNNTVLIMVIGPFNEQTDNSWVTAQR